MAKKSRQAASNILEFDFAQQRPVVSEETASQADKKPSSDSPEESPKNESRKPVIRIDGKTEEERAEERQPTGSMPLLTNKPSKKKKREDSIMGSTTTAPAPKTSTNANTRTAVSSGAKRNIERQAREQKAVGQVLSGVALAIISGIVMVALLATLGGYVLWQQIQDQSVTIAQLETNTKSRISDLRSELALKDEQLSAAQAESNIRMMQMQTSFEEKLAATSANLEKTRQTAAWLASEKKKNERKIAGQQIEISRLSQQISGLQKRIEDESTRRFRR